MNGWDRLSSCYSVCLSTCSMACLVWGHCDVLASLLLHTRLKILPSVFLILIRQLNCSQEYQGYRGKKKILKYNNLRKVSNLGKFVIASSVPVKF